MSAHVQQKDSLPHFNELLNSCRAGFTQPAVESLGLSPRVEPVEVKEVALPRILLNQQFERLPEHHRTPILHLIALQEQQQVRYTVARDSQSGAWNAVKIKHSEMLPRSLLITSSDRVFMLFTRCTRGGDLRVGVGGLKKHSVALDLSSFQYYDAVSASRATTFGLSNLNEFEMNSIICNAVIGGSFVVGVRKDYWIEKLEEGDLIKALSRRPNYFESKRNCMDIALQMGMQLARMHDLGYYHLDVKPDNYLYSMDQEGRLIVRLTDYGFATKKNEPVQSVCGSLLYISPEAYREEDQAVRHQLDQPYRFPSEQHEGWQLGISYLGLFGKHLNKKFLDENRILIQYMNTRALPLSLQLGAVKSLWVNRPRPLQQHEWIKKPPVENRLEYLIYNLLQINPATRWSPKQAAEYLEHCMQRDLARIEKIEKHLFNLRERFSSRGLRESKKMELRIKINRYATRLQKLRQEVYGSGVI